MESLDLRRKIGQLMVFGFDGIEASKDIKELVREHHVGGIILFSRNVSTPDKILSLTTDLQNEAKKSGHKHPLLICIDQENGVVRRLSEGFTMFPGSMLLGATENPHYAYELGVATGKELKALGINWNLAPVVDVNNNPANPVISVRSYGETPSVVSEFGKAAMKGLQEGGVITALKHFPGHGDTSVDSHLTLPVISHSMERLEQVELKPFKECIENGADVVMASHIYFPTIEKRPNVPATLSRDVVTGLLREKLGFKGVVTTDCMEMNAIAGTIGTAKGAVEAVKAGVDLIMISHSYDIQKEAIELIVKAVESGDLDEKVIDEAVERVIKLKQNYLSWNDIAEDFNKVIVPDVVGCKEHHAKAIEIYRNGVTIVKNENIFPVSPNDKVLVIYPKSSSILLVEDRKYSNYSLTEIVKEANPYVDSIILSNPASQSEIEEILKKAEDYQTIIVGTLTAKSDNPEVEIIKKLVESSKKVIVIAMKNPYGLANYPEAPAYIATFEFSYPALKMAVGAIFGLENVHGKLPVTIVKK